MLTTRRAFAVVLTIAAAGGSYVAVRTAQTPRRAPDRAWTEIAWPFTELVWKATRHGPGVTFGPLKDAKY